MKQHGEYTGKTISSVAETKEIDDKCRELTVTFTDGTSMKIEAGVHLHQIPPFTSSHTGHLVVSN